MRKDLRFPIVAAIILLGSFTLFDLHLASQDTSWQGYFSGMIMGLTGAPGDNQLMRVNLYNHSLTLYQDGIIHLQARVAGTGNPYDGTRTPTGEFTILSKEKMHKSRLSGVLMPLAMRFYEGYYFHDIPLTPAGARINTKYSHGCIRLPSDLVQTVYDWTKIGAHVEVYSAWLAKDDQSETVYKLTEDGLRQPITSEAAFYARGFRWEDVVTLPVLELAGLPLGEPLY